MKRHNRKKDVLLQLLSNWWFGLVVWTCSGWFPINPLHEPRVPIPKPPLQTAELRAERENDKMAKANSERQAERGNVFRHQRWQKG